VPRGQRDESLRPYSQISRPEPLLFLPSSSSVALNEVEWTLFQTHYFSEKCDSAENRTRTSESVARNFRCKPKRKFVYIPL
jgi:hypothetical protein